MERQELFKCPECDAIFERGKFLMAQHPFARECEIYGCPFCRTAFENPEMICERPGCYQIANCGTPHPSGYAHTCGTCSNLDWLK